MEAEKITGQENAAKTENQAYQRGEEERTKFFLEFLETLALDDFQQEEHFEAHVKYIEDHRHAREVGKDPD